MARSIDKMSEGWPVDTYRSDVRKLAEFLARDLKMNTRVKGWKREVEKRLGVRVELCLIITSALHLPRSNRHGTYQVARMLWPGWFETILNLRDTANLCLTLTPDFRVKDVRMDWLCLTGGTGVVNQLIQRDFQLLIAYPNKNQFNQVDAIVLKAPRD
jgi:hypothetical protein